ncbi:Hsp20/alpha crystallin family protein [Desulfogranum mediterraneum]|uniref:Hsp20/alpha crystallin family protein n=1 Tax=Desulfogranum mediterraneum TaxID=160661 RepID=UPI0003FA5609|nr:Hsp20/alpha crystallin family protein [Desulfogranum mediterraneum]
MRSRLNELERMLNTLDFFRPGLGQFLSALDRPGSPNHPWLVNGNTPRTNLYDTGNNLELSVELPGIAKEELKIKVQGNYLEISGQPQTKPLEGYRVHRSERDMAAFSRSFTLPYDVEADKVEANLKNGILKMVLPKAEAAKPREIAIS